MAWYGNGFVFTSEPDWQNLATHIPDKFSLRAYKHRTEELWLLDLWEPTRKSHAPFTEHFSENTELSTELSGKTAKILNTFSSIGTFLPESTDLYGNAWIENTAKIASITSKESFFFAADDEMHDFACSASPDGSVRFRLSYESVSINYANQRFEVVPFVSEEDEENDYELSINSIRQLNNLESVFVMPPEDTSGGKTIYGNAINLWPSGDPAELLGVGTWEPFENLESAYAIAFERLHNSAVSDAPNLQPKVQPLLANPPTSGASLFIFFIYRVGFIIFLIFTSIIAAIFLHWSTQLKASTFYWYLIVLVCVYFISGITLAFSPSRFIVSSNRFARVLRWSFVISLTLAVVYVASFTQQS